MGFTDLSELHLIGGDVGRVAHRVVPEGQTAELTVDLLVRCIAGQLKNLVIVLKHHLVGHVLTESK